MPAIYRPKIFFHVRIITYISILQLINLNLLKKKFFLFTFIVLVYFRLKKWVKCKAIKKNEYVYDDSLFLLQVRFINGLIMIE